MNDHVLVLLPPPGAGAGIFRAWQKSTWADTLRPIQFPGREDRFLDPVYASRGAAVIDLLDRVRDASNGVPYSLFAHCGTSLVALDLASRLESSGHGPKRLIVSSSPSPRRRRCIPRAVVNADPLSPELFAELGASDVTPDQELLEMIAPAIRSDCGLFADPRPDAATRIAAPITALAAASLTGTKLDDVDDWRLSTAGDFALITAGLPDNYLHTALDRLGEILEEVTSADVVP